MLLGWVGRKLNEKDLCNLSLSRIGGQPVWLQPTQSAEQQMLTCELCQGNLVLVGQFAAGYDAMPQRLLHIFACSACSSDSRAWRVYRSVCETTVDPTQAQDQGQDTDHISQKSTLAVDSTTGSDDWGVHPDNWGVTDDTDWGAQPVATAALDAEIDALLQARATQGAQAPSVGSQQQKAPKKKMESPQQDEMSWTGTCDKCLKETWPCHVIDVDCEPAANPKSGEHERELLERYLQSDLAKEDADAVLPASALPPEVAEQLRMENGSTDENTDGGQVDEEPDDDDDDDDDDAGCDNGERWLSKFNWLSKFQRRIERSPTQIVRYAWGGTPLWVAPPPPQLKDGIWPPKCEKCGCSRIFELQLLPTLLSQMCDAYSDDTSVSKMEWGTADVYTCSKDCLSDGLCNEFVIVQPAI